MSRDIRKWNIAKLLILGTNLTFVIHQFLCPWETNLWHDITTSDALAFNYFQDLKSPSRLCLQNFLCSPLRPRPHVSGYFWIRNFFFPDTKISASTRYVITAYSYRIRPSTRIRIHWGLTKLSHQALVRPGLTQNRRVRHCFPTRLSSSCRLFCPVDNVKSLQMSSRLLA